MVWAGSNRYPATQEKDLQEEKWELNDEGKNDIQAFLDS